MDPRGSEWSGTITAQLRHNESAHSIYNRVFPRNPSPTPGHSICNQVSPRLPLALVHTMVTNAASPRGITKRTKATMVTSWGDQPPVQRDRPKYAGVAMANADTQTFPTVRAVGRRNASIHPDLL